MLNQILNRILCRIFADLFELNDKMKRRKPEHKNIAYIHETPTANFGIKKSPAGLLWIKLHRHLSLQQVQVDHRAGFPSSQTHAQDCVLNGQSHHESLYQYYDLYGSPRQV